MLSFRDCRHHQLKKSRDIGLLPGSKYNDGKLFPRLQKSHIATVFHDEAVKDSLVTKQLMTITSNERKNGSDDIYTLNGYKTSRPRPQVLNHKQKGVYIVNKKKVIL